MSLYQYLQFQSNTTSFLSEFFISVFGPSFPSSEKPAPAILTAFTLLLSLLTVTNYWDCREQARGIMEGGGSEVVRRHPKAIPVSVEQESTRLRFNATSE